MNKSNPVTTAAQIYIIKSPFYYYYIIEKPCQISNLTGFNWCTLHLNPNELKLLLTSSSSRFTVMIDFATSPYSCLINQLCNARY